MIRMRAFHAADIHLDSPLRGLSLYEDAPVDELRSATRRAFDNLIEAAIDEEVDLLLLAGDVFDGDWLHYSSGAHFARQMLRLREAGIRVVSVAGNHDAASKITKSLRLPDNVTVLSARRPDTWRDDALGVAVHGQSYAEPAVTVNLCVGYPAPIAGLINIGLLHTSADGRPGHERYAPCTIDSLVNRGFDYFALGHVHEREVLSADPPVVFCGSIQGRGLHEAGPKGATLIEFDDGRITHEHRVLDVVRWAVVEVDAAGCSDRDEVCGRVATAIRTAASNAHGRLLAAQVAIVGATDAHGQLLGDSERLSHEVALAAAEGAGAQVWVQGTVVRTSSPRPRIAAGDDAVGELVAELEEILADEASLADVGKVLESLAGALPVAVLGEFNPMDPDVLRSLMEGVCESLPLALTEAPD
jgi:UDP-2,3-diacylglucosamine pyrophosphatase LpxH